MFYVVLTIVIAIFFLAAYFVGYLGAEFIYRIHKWFKKKKHYQKVIEQARKEGQKEIEKESFNRKEDIKIIGSEPKPDIDTFITKMQENQQKFKERMQEALDKKNRILSQKQREGIKYKLKVRMEIDQIERDLNKPKE